MIDPHNRHQLTSNQHRKQFALNFCGGQSVTPGNFLVRIDVARERSNSYRCFAFPQSTWLLRYNVHITCACDTKSEKQLMNKQ